MVTPISPPSTEQVLAAIQQLYLPSSDKSKQRDANIWLEDFQKTPSAWTVADTLLRSPAVGPEAHTFAAQTFRQKIMYDLEQIPPPQRAALRDSIVTLLHIYKSSPSSVTIQLCLALADLAIQYFQWDDPVGQMIASYGSDASMASVLLDFLKVLPEELYENPRIPVEKDDIDRRGEALLTKKVKDVLTLILAYSQSPGITNGMRHRLLSCLFTWLKSGQVDVATVVGTPIVDYAFVALQTEELFEVASDAISEMVCRSVIPQDVTDTVTPSIVAANMYPRLLALRPMLYEAIQEDDTEKMRTLARIYADAGAAYVSQMMLQPEFFAGLVEVNLTCTAVDELDIVRVTFHFWFSLSETLVLPEHANARAFFIPIYIRLIDVMIKHLNYPQDLARWTADERDDFKDFRYVMGDVMKDCVRIVGEGPALARPHAILKGFMIASSQQSATTVAPPTLDPNIPWQSIEAPLFALRVMGAAISKTEDVYLPEIMSWLPQLPPHPKVKYAAILLIGRYAEWTKRHSTFIPYQLNFVSKGFDDADCTAASSQAMRFLCESCGLLLVDYLNELHPFYNQLMSKLGKEDRREVAEAISHVIAAVPLPRLLEALQTFCLPIAQQLHTIATVGRHPTDSDAEIKVILNAEDQLEILTIFFKVVKPMEIIPNTPHPLVLLLSDLWPVTKILLHNYKATRLSEGIARFLRHAVETCKHHLGNLTPQILDALCEAYDETGLSCYLWVAKICVITLGSDETSEGRAIFAMAERMVVKTLRVLSASAAHDMDSHAEVIEDFFRLLQECIIVCPLLVMSSSALPTLLGLAQGCFSLTQPDPLLSVLRFIRDLFGMASTRFHIHQLPLSYATAVTELGRAHGQALVELVWRGILFDFPRTSVAEAGSILRVLADLLPNELVTWTQGVIDTLHDAGSASIRGALNGDVFMQKFKAALSETEFGATKRCIQDFASSYRRRNLIDARATRGAR
ncbi:hypothetical protein SeMB42_g01357 [Synchytrium endobioticum]|uniref:Importin N-terminal domain-containing protein n=1 Tax=Synchytrium endobioticum TaxID=286115 RepID=A0A507DDT3_9FUNG|nr:hypothetical protein SeLEV6574_g01375 [Synchytrium endobioticum]TPX52526.1 hypothetical protein SeMB42_g01357 [Synchytrium endobioticum]